MVKDYIQVNGDHFERNGEKIMLRGWAFGSWMNFEHFMLGMPGTNSMILEAFGKVYGEERAAELADRIITDMVREEDIQYLKELGTNTVRIVLGYHWFWDDAEPFVMKEQGLKYLDRVLRYCADNGMFAILDLHSTPGSQNTDWHSDNRTGVEQFWQYRCFQDQVVWFWEEIAKRCADNPWVVGYDVINEPGWGVKAEQINGFYARVIEAVRRHDPHHILFLEGADFGRDFSILEPAADPQISYTVHFYPFVLEENILDPALDDGKRMEIFTEIFDRQIKETAKLNRPLWCGESGYEILDGQEEFYAMLLMHNIELCESRGISWNLWTYKDARKMGIVVPKKDSPWMKLRRRIEEHWNHDWEQKVSLEIVQSIAEKYYGAPLKERFAYELEFRMRSFLHQIEVETILVPALKEIPWEEMREYPESFLFGNCDKRTQITDVIREKVLTVPRR